MKLKVTGTRVPSIAPVSHLADGTYYPVVGMALIQGNQYYFIQPEGYSEPIGIRSDEGTLDRTPGNCFLVVTLGCWGRGQTIREAAQSCRQSGAALTDKARVQLILGDATAEVNSSGYVVREPASQNLDVCTARRLSMLLSLDVGNTAPKLVRK